MKNFILFIGIILLLLIIGSLLLRSRTALDNDSSVVCTMDAMQCPDGSYVGRIPPNCEFAPCP